MSSKSKRKATKLHAVSDSSIEALKMEAGQFANAFQLINQSTFPATKAHAVHTAMTFLDQNYAKLADQIKKLSPEKSSEAVLDTVETQPEQTA